MCGRIVWVWDAATGQLVRRFDDKATDDPDVRRVLEKNRYNVPPSSHLPVIAGAPEGSTRVQIVRWGFPIPQRPNGVFNTRIETAFTSPMWRGIVGTHHCLFPVKGFYEWDRRTRPKVPHFVRRRDARPMLLAGVLGRRHWEGQDLLCGSIVTCPPNRLLAPLHDRMPVVIEDKDADGWLHPAGEGAVQRLAVPAAEETLVDHAVGPKVNSTANDAPGLMEPDRTQRKL